MHKHHEDIEASYRLQAPLGVVCVGYTNTLLTKNVTTLCVRGAILCEGSRVDQQV